MVIASQVDALPDEAAISTATLAELHFGAHVARTSNQRQQRLRRLTEIESRLEALPVDSGVARSYGSLAHTMVAAGRKPRARIMDVLIAATAHAHGVALYTHNRDDFEVFADLVEVHAV